MTSAALFGILAGLTGFLAVAAGAFGAHALRVQLPSAHLQIFETAARYQLIHAIMLFVVSMGLQLGHGHRRSFNVAGWLFVAGQVLFPGSLYALALTSVSRWGAVTPIGGLCYLAGWLALAVAFTPRSGAVR